LRVNRLLSERGVASRRKAEELILAGKVTINGEVVTDLSRRFPADARVKVNGKLFTEQTKRLFVFYKPRSVVTTLKDPEGRKCISDFLGDIPGRVYPVGRLDFDVSGLLLITNDGDLAEKLLHPRFEIEREYLARVKSVTEESINELIQGVTVEGKLLKAKKVRIAPNSKVAIRLLGEPKDSEEILSVTVAEGANHFVKKLLAATGIQLIKLSRVKFGKYQLGGLAPGELREVPID